MKVITFKTNSELDFTLTENIYLDNIDSMEDYRDQSRSGYLNIYSEQSGNGGYWSIFAGNYNEFLDYITEEKQDELEMGTIHFNDEMTELTNAGLMKYLKDWRKK